MHNYTKSLLAFGLLAVSIFSCDKTQKNSDKINETKKEEQIIINKPSKNQQFKMELVEKKSKQCVNNECARVKLEYPVYNGQDANYKHINKMIDMKLRDLLSDFVMESNQTNTIQEIIDAFISGYEDFKTTFPEAHTPWFMEITAIPSYESKEFISMRFELNCYTGGAHNNEERIYSNMNMRGKEIEKWSYFFRDKVSLKELAEAKFRKQNKLSADQSLTDAGFMFADNKFEISDNFGFNEKGLVIYYNSYEIASHSKGPTEINIPFSELKSNFRF